MKTYRELLGLSAGDETVWMIDRYQMGRLKLKEYFIRDQFSEERHSLGHTKIFFWQHRGKDSCTVKVHATITDSNESAHKAMNQFMSRVADPSVFSLLAEDLDVSHWFNKTEAEKVHFVNSGTAQLSAVLIWGNIFFHLESSGEQDHSIKLFLENLGDNWAHMQLDNDNLPDFELSADKTELKVGEVATLSRKGLDKHEEFSSFIYAAGPRRLVQIYRENDIFKLKIKTPPVVKKALVSPFVILIGVRPDGKFIKSKRLKFTIVQD